MHTPAEIDALVREANRLRARAVADALDNVWDRAKRLMSRLARRSRLAADRSRELAPH